jgi:hypothetical protein
MWKTVICELVDFLEWNERIAGANSVGDDRIFLNGMKENR